MPIERVCGVPKRLMVTLGMISIQVTNVAYNVVAKLAVGGGGGGGGAHNGTNTSGALSLFLSLILLSSSAGHTNLPAARWFAVRDGSTRAHLRTCLGAISSFA